MNILKRKKIAKKDSIHLPFNSSWWQGLLKKYKKDTGGVIDKNDPEYDAQKIYMHWIKLYL